MFLRGRLPLRRQCLRSPEILRDHHLGTDPRLHLQFNQQHPTSLLSGRRLVDGAVDNGAGHRPLRATAWGPQIYPKGIFLMKGNRQRIHLLLQLRLLLQLKPYQVAMSVEIPSGLKEGKRA